MQKVNCGSSFRSILKENANDFFMEKSSIILDMYSRNMMLSLMNLL